MVFQLFHYYRRKKESSMWRRGAVKRVKECQCNTEVQVMVEKTFVQDDSICRVFTSVLWSPLLSARFLWIKFPVSKPSGRQAKVTLAGVGQACSIRFINHQQHWKSDGLGVVLQFWFSLKLFHAAWKYYVWKNRFDDQI